MARGLKKKKVFGGFCKTRLTDGILMETKVIGIKANTIEMKFIKIGLLKWALYKMITFLLPKYIMG